MLSDIINVFVGIVLTFATMSLAASSVTEAIASALKWRSTTLIAGLQQLLNDPNLTGLANAILNHGAVNPRSTGTSLGAATAKGVAPSYIPPQQFAWAFLDVLQTTRSTGPVPGVLPPIGTATTDSSAPQTQTGLARQDLSTSIDQIPDAQIRTLLQGIYTRANGDIDKIKLELANWFDSGMDRVSGMYKRKSQIVSFAVALALAVALNVSVFRVAQTIWAHPQISENLTQLSRADESALSAIDHFKQTDFPYGWDDTNFGKQRAQLFGVPSLTTLQDWLASWALLLLGWAATAVATLFGAPFWFDTLQRFVRLGGTGPKPDSQTVST